MPNELHQFLHQGFVDSEPVLGETITVGSVTCTAFVTPADERLSMELTGFIDMIDLAATVKVSDFASKPAINLDFTYNGATYRLRSIKEDQSAYVLGFKKISQ